MMPTDPEMLERAKLTTLAMSQFENYHAPVREASSNAIICPLCDTDWPCQRMATMLIVQSISMLQQMLPTGGVGGVLARFAGGGSQK
jgi:hypothetical protein